MLSVSSLVSSTKWRAMRYDDVGGWNLINERFALMIWSVEGPIKERGLPRVSVNLNAVELCQLIRQELNREFDLGGKGIALSLHDELSNEVMITPAG